MKYVRSLINSRAAVVTCLVALAIWALAVWTAATEYKYKVLGAAFVVALGVFIAVPSVKGARGKRAGRRTREDAMREGIVEHRLGVDDFDDAKEALVEGKYVVFDTSEMEEDAK